MQETFIVKLTKALVFDGLIHKAGAFLELVEDEAKALLHRGQAVLADDQEIKTASGSTVQTEQPKTDVNSPLTTTVQAEVIPATPVAVTEQTVDITSVESVSTAESPVNDNQTEEPKV